MLDAPHNVISCECQPEHFASVELARLFGAIRDAVTRGESVALPLLAAAAGVDEVMLIQIGDEALIKNINGADAPAFAAIVRNESARRQLGEALQRARTKYDHADPRQVASDLMSALSEIDSGTTAMQSIADVLDRVDNERKTGAATRTVIATRIELLDAQMHGGLRRGQLHIVAGDTSTGKSSLACGCALAAARAGVTAVICSLEDEAEYSALRLVSMQSGQPLASVMRHYGDLETVTSVQQVYGLPILIADRLPSDLSSAAFLLRQAIAKHRVGFLVFDYLQIARHMARAKSNYEKTEAIVMELFRLARETDTAVVLVSQYNYDGKLEGGALIAQRAYTVIELVNHQLADIDGPIPIIEARITKNKNGPTGSVPLKFDGATVSFSEPDDTMLGRYIDARRKIQTPTGVRSSRARAPKADN